MNLPFTMPTEQSKLQEDLTFGKVENCLIDMCMVVSAIRVSTNVENVEVAPVVVSAGDGDELEPAPISEVIQALPKYQWKIPAAVEKGWEIPIAITSTAALPEPGHFKRLATDIAVNAA